MAAVANEAAAASIEGSATETIEKPLPHKLERKWTFWFDNQSKPNQGAAWGTSLRKIYSFDTVEEFWCLYEQIFKPSKREGKCRKRLHVAEGHSSRDAYVPVFHEDFLYRELANLLPLNSAHNFIYTPPFEHCPLPKLGLKSVTRKGED
ncbi:hypothetical protein NC652_025126 [Populus alba x Populus x berolinensis]|uniref:Eukaryotic translation initiation factor isoform 4E n=1 Tax=Populus tomentosa TaxID=118781 RepID=A0A8X8CME6_POPTO|nr:hypothetical protein POTOM_035653 [Populus tomentosa]KAJ6898501.1 hypothetical protein NC652_025120 [Populus alba x Populus x berolinensis]KAG6759185.1 hypothetical protein POTOM_035654 [Populus tomentosa]KAG6759187.1 hypothetical protein POTOM_035656 [Populus tomentosa]KAJ6898503.1 hypothetical protein NC652_025122 [Populus alba x Populus x berolinensis]